MGEFWVVLQRVRAFSLYREFLIREVIDENILLEKKYDMLSRMQDYCADWNHLRIILAFGMIICLLNVCFTFKEAWFRKKMTVK